MRKYCLVASVISVLGGFVGLMFNFSLGGLYVSYPMHMTSGFLNHMVFFLLFLAPALMIVLGVRILSWGTCGYILSTLTIVLAFVQYFNIVGGIFMLFPLLSVLIVYVGRKMTWVPDELKDKLSK